MLHKSVEKGIQFIVYFSVNQNALTHLPCNIQILHIAQQPALLSFSSNDFPREHRFNQSYILIWWTKFRKKNHNSVEMNTYIFEKRDFFLFLFFFIAKAFVVVIFCHCFVVCPTFVQKPTEFSTWKSSELIPFSKQQFAFLILSNEHWTFFDYLFFLQ